MERHHIKLLRPGMDEIEALHNDYVTFTCMRGYIHGGQWSGQLKQQCVNGKMRLPTCWLYSSQG